MNVREMKPWVHGTPGWKFSKDSGCYYKASHLHTPPSEFCFGERYIHCDFGHDSYGIIWVGSTSDNWHGFGFRADLTAALKWVSEAEFPQYGSTLWDGSLVDKFLA